MKSSSKVKRLIIILVAGVALVISIALLSDFFSAEPTESWGVFNDDVNITDDKVEIQASILNSSKYIKDYRYDIKGDALYVWVYTAPIFKLGPDKLGQMNIKIEMDTLAINKIYIRGWSYKDAELIWERD